MSTHKTTDSDIVSTTKYSRMTLLSRIQFAKILIITLVLSLLWHLLIIFYMPPIEDMEFLSLKSQKNRPTEPLRIKIQGKMNSGSTDAKSAEQVGDFSEQLGVDKEKWAELLSKLKDNTGLSTSFKQVQDEINQNANVKKSYINRPRKHEDIVIKDVFPTIHNIEKPFADILNAAPQDLQDHNERNKIIQKYRDWDLRKSIDASLIINIDSNENNDSSIPLDFPEAKRKKYFDENLGLPKTLQLNNFIRKYFSYDPNKGDLPIATRELYYDNLQRLAYSFSSDPSYLYLDYFLENLNKEDFLKNALYQASKLDSTKTQTELLFALEDIYHIQQRAWRYYFEYDRMYESIPAAKRNHLRIETLKRVVAGYKDTLKSKQIKDYKNIESLYRKKRMEILDYVISHTPESYRRSDAVFEKAAIYWQQGFTENKSELKLQTVKLWLSIPLNNAPEQPGNDKLSQVTLKKLSPELKNYLSNNTAMQQTAQLKIQRIVSTRHSLRITKKRMREEKLLWK